jgi:hypothetical protein
MSSEVAVATVVPFELVVGYADKSGRVHRSGEMRLATAADEILPLRDPRVQANPAYLSVIVLARVVTRLGDLERVTPNVIEGLFAADLTYLQDLYDELNGAVGTDLVTCPRCNHEFRSVAASPGKSTPTPSTVSSTS